MSQLPDTRIQSLPGRSAAAMEAIHRFVFDTDAHSADPVIERFVSWFRQRYGSRLVGVLFFGSCVSEETRSATSFPDFFVIVDNYRAHGSVFGALMHRILPPDLYHLRLPDRQRERGFDCKYYLLSTGDLQRLTSESAPDLYVAGRLSKRTICLYSRDEAARHLLARAAYTAAWNVLLCSSALVKEPLAAADFYRFALGLSYRGETRIEGSGKIEALYRAGQAYCEAVFGAMTDCMVREGFIQRDSGGRLSRSPASDGPQGSEVDAFLERTRRRARMRWPKMMLTVDNWVDQLLMKLERTHGIRIDIPPWERRIILITGWRHYFRLKKAGKIG